MPVIINPIFTKDFPDLGRAVLDTDLIVVAVPGDNVTYKTTVSELRSNILPDPIIGTADGSGNFTATNGTDRLVAVYDGDDLFPASYNKSTKVLSGLVPGASITAYFI